jgi:acyl-CoA hydrolase
MAWKRCVLVVAKALLPYLNARDNQARTSMQILNVDNLPLDQIVRPGDTVLWGQAAAEPVPLTTALFSKRHAIGRFNVFLGMTWSESVRSEFSDCVSFSSYCGAGSNRLLAKAGVLDILPCHYSQFGPLMRSGTFKVDVLMVQVSTPDKDGRYSLSMANDYLVPALASARVIIAEINEAAPWTHGTTLSDADIDYAIHTNRPPLEVASTPARDTDIQIAKNVAGLIEDGTTLQIGIGSLPETILGQLHQHRNLGIHSGAIGDAVALLTQAEVINNSHKHIDCGKTVAGVVMGSSISRSFVHRNPSVEMRSVDYTHNAGILSSFDKFAAINSALEVDLTGQINAEVANGTYLGAIGGAVDFIRGAHASRGGVPIIALGAVAGAGGRRISRIVSSLNGPVSTPRCDAGVIVTEYGVADLRGLTLRQRVKKMIDVAHPDFRAALEEQAQQAVC